MVSNMKVYGRAPHSKLNGFRMFLALSDRLASEGELHLPPTVDVGLHHVIYIFTDSTGELSLTTISS
jgi:hypothetical protein